MAATYYEMVRTQLEKAIWLYEALEQNVEWSGVDGWMEWSGVDTP